MDEIKIKPNLVIFELFEEDKNNIISINCSEILLMSRGLNADNSIIPNCVNITLKNGLTYCVVGELRDLHSRILRS